MGNKSSKPVVTVPVVDSPPGPPLARIPAVQRICETSTTNANIAAIDFGSTYCSLAYKTEYDTSETVVRLDGSDRRVPNAMVLKILKEELGCIVCKSTKCENERMCIERYGSGRPMNRKKTKQYSCQVNYFGYVAQRNYQTVRKKQYDSHIYLERIKVTLMEATDLNRLKTIKAINGREFYLIEVIGIALKYLKDLLLEKVHHGGHSDLKASSFLWVITVPAIWGIGGKQIMREAAYLAGLCSDAPGITSLTSTAWDIKAPIERHPDRVILALEPEAAALSCQALSQKHTADYCKATPSPQSESLRYLVVDIGGGTVDIAAHLVQKGERGITSGVDMPPQGNGFGGTAVNRAFEEFLSSLISKEHIAAFVEADEKNRALLNGFLYSSFEKEKLRFGDVVDPTDDRMLSSEFLVLKLDPKFCLAFGNDLKKIGATHPHVEYSHDEQQLCISYTKVKELFQPAVDGILECTNTALEMVEKKGNVDVIYLVGGFGGCKYIYGQLEKFLKETSRHSIRIIVPREHNLAVIRGAVLFGTNPQLFSSRIADATYGMAISIPYQEGHNEAYSYKDARGKTWTNDVFSVCIEKGESIESGIVFKQTVSQPRRQQKTMTLELLSTKQTGIQYVRNTSGDRIVNFAGSIVIELPKLSSFATPPAIDVTLDFSGTEIRARAHFQNERDDSKDIFVIFDCL